MLRGAGHRPQYGALALHVGYLRLQTHTLRLCNTYRFSIATIGGRTLLIVMLYVLCLTRCVLCIVCTHWNNGILWVAVRDVSISVESVPSKIDNNHFLLRSGIDVNNN